MEAPQTTPSTQPGVSSTPSQPAAPESELWAGRTSWKHYFFRIAAWIVGNIVAAVLIVQWAWAGEKLGVGGTFWVIVGLVAVSGVLLMLKPALQIWGRRYRLTTQRFFVEVGILSKTIDQTELIRVDDVRVYKSLFDRIFGLGTISLLSTDVTNKEITIEGVSEAESVAEKVRANMRAQRGKALFVENL